MKKILIISNNVISATNNNGKTLLSLFSEEKDAQIFQLYFSNEQPTLFNFDYFKISDSDLINLRLKGKKTYGQQYPTETPSEPQISKKHSSISRLFRELIWSNVCNIPELKEWVLDINPTHIFFVGGDCLFAYKIFNYIFELLSKKPVCSLFITDDYVSKKGIFNPFELLRRNCIKKTIGITLKNVKYFFTISNKMKNYYKEIFGVDSKVLFNIQLSKQMVQNNKIPNKNPVLLYAGSLYYGRDEALAEFALGAENFQLIVCSNQISNNKRFNKAVSLGKIKFLGKLNFDELNDLYKKVDYLLYVESFKKKYINKIRYSFSTKITDYLSTSLPIICYGPNDVGSIEELSRYSLFISKQKFNISDLDKILRSEDSRIKLIHKAESGYNDLLNIEAVKNNFLEAFKW